MAKNSFVAGVTFIGPRPWPEGPYKIGSVRPSFCLFVKFSRNWPISFFLNLAWCYGPIYGCVWQSQIFWKKSPSGKNYQKWPKNRVFGLFKKIMSLVLSGICVKRKFLWFINMKKLHAWGKSGSQVKGKNGSPPVRFHYSLIVNISLTH